MNNIDAVTTYKFNSPFELAKWIKANIPNELRQEQLMYEGVQYKHVNKTHYEICVELNQQQLSLVKYGDKTIAEFDLSIRTINQLKALGVTTIKQLVELDTFDIIQTHNTNKRTIQELKELASSLGLTLNTKI